VKKSCDVSHNEHQNSLAIIPYANQDADPIAVEPSDQNGNVARSGEHKSSEISSKYRHLINTPKPKKNINLLDFPEKSEDAEKSGDVSSRCQFFGTPKLQRKSLGNLDDMDLGNRWEGIKRKTNKGFKEGKYRSTYLRNPGEGGTHKYKDRTLNASAYKNLINSYLSNINTTIPVEEETPIIDQWKKCNTTNVVEQNKETEISHEKAEEDMLWKELEVGLASVYFDDSEVKACLAIVFAFLFLLRFVLFFFLRLIISSII
jgi:DNA repair and recombination RAD54-like protein